MLSVRLSARGLRRSGLSLGLGLPLLLSSSPAAAGTATFGVSAATTLVGLLAALWTVITTRDSDVGVGGLTLLAALMAFAFGGAFYRRLRRGAPARSRGHAAAGAAAAMPSLFRGTARPALPDGVDGAAVLADARSRFIRLQAAWDARDLVTLRSLTMPEIFEELRHVLAAQESRSRTDVITLHAELLALEEHGASYLASIEFSGLICESAEAGAVPFRELWMLAAAKGEAAGEAPSWRLARQQALF